MKPRQSNMNQQQGLTLIEVLVALMVVAVALGAAIQSVGTTANNTTMLREQLFARWVASNQVTKLRLEKAWPDLGDAEGTSTMIDHEWSWTQTTEKTPNDNMRSVTVSVWTDATKQGAPQAAMTTFLVN